ncbi:unnamed protein product [Caretta caretta]
MVVHVPPTPSCGLPIPQSVPFYLTLTPTATAPAGASAMEGTGVTSAAAMPTADSRGAPAAGGKGPAKTTRPPVAGATPTAAAPPLTTASLPAAPSTGSAGVPPSAPRMYARAAAAPPPSATSSSLLPTASATINSGRGPFPTITRKHGVQCLLVPASPHMETYVRALARVVGSSAIVVASKMYGKSH